MPINDIPITDLHGVGEVLAKRLLYIGIKTVRDLVFYFPRDYEDLSVVQPIAAAQEGEKINIKGKIERINTQRTFRKRMAVIQARVKDETGALNVVWFNQPYLQEQLKVGDELQLSGVVKRDRYGLSLHSPVYEKVSASRELIHTGRIVPKYSLTAGITQKQIRYLMKQSLSRVLPIADFLPPEIVSTYSLLALTDALRGIHFPENEMHFEQAKRRLEFEELYVAQLMAQCIRKDIAQQTAPTLKLHEQELQQFVSTLPFRLTNAQRRAAWAILQDLEKTHPMNRLLVGDVGSGKTIVAAMAMWNTVLCGKQAVLMAPTEILAQQHTQYLEKLFAHADIQIELWTSRTSKEKKQLTDIQKKHPNIIIGTHALLQDYARFENVGLVIIDEQHRFGVRQRKFLKEHSGVHTMMPHLLSMTATPIPRTFALAAYGDLDISIIDEQPPGRKPVMTRLVPREKRIVAYRWLQKHIVNGEQVFVICPIIEESDTLGVKSVSAESLRLRDVFPGVRIEMLHGKMKGTEKDAIMENMRAGKIDILVSTSVIEVGVDIPNATIMLIEDADRFGLAQLHQFRGRVGRSNKQSYCLLFTNAQSAKTVERLDALTKSQNGFQLAEYDLKLRGAGELYGTAQSGFSPYFLTSLQQPELIQETREAALKTMDTNLITHYPLLQEKLNARLLDVHLE
ncbi:MAG: ATP-dependent DNA helicase RecG [Candidatus Kerfeldbacteria bacterium]|nr:ATP-dependent DNA helicase RecG [Candidatus Kerfeldbacteria bacterium]